jgi:hypothetical protein
MQAVQKSFLTLHEFAEMVGRTYSAVHGWVTSGRVQAEKREAGERKTYYRVPVEEAERVRQMVESGLWS